MPTLFNRKAADSATETAEPEVVEPARPRNYTPSKRELGVATPRRAGTNPRRPGSKIPMDKATAKVERRRQAGERRAAMMAGEDWALAPRDRGPERKLARDIVDSRRNLGEFLFFGIIALMVLSIVTGQSAQLALGIELLAIVLIVPVVVDSVLLSRKVKRLVRQKYPKANLRGIGYYALSRGASPRKWRAPRPQVDRGTPIKI